MMKVRQAVAALILFHHSAGRQLDSHTHTHPTCSLNACAVPYGTITKIESFPIEGKEEYSILSLHLGSGASSK